MDVVPAPTAVVDRLRLAGCVFAEDEAALLVAAAADDGDLAALVARRVAGEPLEQLLGWAAFDGLRIALAPGVFVPRVRSEFLAERAAAVARPASVVLDLCCGSGALGAAVAARVPGIELHAADLDAAAVACARVNLPGAAVYEGNLFDALPAALRGRVDVLVSNVPYVPTSAIALMPPEARDHEPRLALDGGPDGLAVARRVLAGAPAWLAPGGTVLVETSEAQVPAALAAVSAVGLVPVVDTDDERGATVVSGRR